MSARIQLCSVGLLLLVGCTVGPNYKRPAVNTPATYRGLAPDQETAAAQASSLGDEKWWDIFNDPQLQQLIRTALKNNYDVRIAATRILEAQAQVAITRSNQFPTINAGAQTIDQRVPQTKLSKPYGTSANQLSGTLSWNLDFWGQYRRASEAARAQLLASDWAQKEVFSALVASVAGAYFQLLSSDLQLTISKDTLNSRQDSLKLTRTLADHGATSMLDVRQAENLVYTAAANIPLLERNIEQQENLINILLGDNPGPVTRGKPLLDQTRPAQVPAGLPSALIERRPDIRQAEDLLIAANAQIGVARAAYFPSIALTATGGLQSSALSSLFTGPAGTWNFGGSLTQPIFTAGRLRANVKLSEALQQEALLTYQQTIQRAFQDVSNALVAYRKDSEYRMQQELLTRALRDAVRLSDMRYRGGVTSYLEVLDNNSSLFSAELSLAQARNQELQDLVSLYQALGGGWQ